MKQRDKWNPETKFGPYMVPIWQLQIEALCETMATEWCRCDFDRILSQKAD